MWNTSKVKKMQYMFEDAEAFKQDVRQWGWAERFPDLWGEPKGPHLAN